MPLHLLVVEVYNPWSGGYPDVMNTAHKYANYDWTIWIRSSYEHALPHLEKEFGLVPQGWIVDSYRHTGKDKDNEPFDYIQEVKVLPLKDAQNRQVWLAFQSVQNQILWPNKFCVYSEDENLKKEVYEFLKNLEP